MAVMLFSRPMVPGWYDEDLSLLIAVTAQDDARRDLQQGERSLYALMADLFANGDVRPSDWDQYRVLYAAEADRR